jgi:hypothetical protein
MGSGSTGYNPMGSAAPAYDPTGGSTGYDPAGSGAAGYPMGYPMGPGATGSTPSTGNPNTPVYPPGYDPRNGGSTGYPDGTTGYPPGYGPEGAAPGSSDGYPNPDGTYGQPALPPKPKTIREKALEAFRAGNEDEGFDLFAAHYLTSPGAGSELARNMQWSPGLRRPTLATRFGIAIIYSQPFNWEGHPQPLGSPELEAALGELEKNAGSGERKASRRIGEGRRRNRENRQGGGAGGPNPMNPGAGGDFGSGSGYNTNQQESVTPLEELEYFTGELGTKLLARMKAKMEAGTFGSILRDANKAMPAVVERPADDGGEGFAAAGPMGPMGRGAGMRSGPPGRMRPPGAVGGAPGVPGGRPEEFGAGGEEGGDELGSGALTGQLLPGITFLGAVENVKELGEIVKTFPVDVVFIFAVEVRPATASNWVNNNTRLRIVPAGKVTEPLYTSPVINNKAVYEGRKKKGEADPVNKMLADAIAALEAPGDKCYKVEPLPAKVTPEIAVQRIKALAGTNPENAVPMLVEARYYVAKKLLKPEEMMSVAMTSVTEAQLAGVSELLEGEDVKQKISEALTGGERPKTVLGRFGDALAGAGGLGNLVPVPELPPIGAPGSVPAIVPGAVPEAAPINRSGPPGASGASRPPAGYPMPGSGPPAGYSSGGPPGASRPPMGISTGEREEP